MFSTIVVGTDGSPTAQAAVALAMDLARQNGATVHLVHAYKTASAGMAVAQAGAAVVADDSLVRAVAKDAADSVLTEAAGTGGGVATASHAVNAAPAEAVIKVAEEVGADLIVVGSKGMQGARRLIGSVPNSIAHGAPCHVLIAKTA